MVEDSKLPTDVSRRQILAAAAAVSSQLILPIRAGANSKSLVAAKRVDSFVDRFIEDCIAANSADDPQAAMLEVLARAVRKPKVMLAAVGEPEEAGITVLHRSNTLTIFNAAWTPQMNLMPHNHLMWANIGIYTGREDNLL